MAGIYIHIPFCKQACHYCDFYFSTSTKYRQAMVAALTRELELRVAEITEEIETIYFGGGTPSILQNDEIEMLIETVYTHYQVSASPEITLEANPDDLKGNRIRLLAETRINRLSIGIQSFFEEDLKMMNRAHDAAEANECLNKAIKYFDNISIDMMYGMPGMSTERWKENIAKALSFGIPHISSYALTVEPNTALFKMIASGKIEMPGDEVANEHFHCLVDTLEQNGFVHYELSNFGKPGGFSRNNSAYWLGKKYIGIGPSAHSFDGQVRSWNIANNLLYIKAVSNSELPSEREVLTTYDRYNEYIMTGLRTIWGVDLTSIRNEFGDAVLAHLLEAAAKHIAIGHIVINQNVLLTTRSGKFLTDGIASDLFLVNLD